MDKQTVRNRKRLKDQVEKKGKREGGELQRGGRTEESREELGKKVEKFNCMLQAAPWVQRSQLRWIPTN